MSSNDKFLFSLVVLSVVFVVTSGKPQFYNHFPAVYYQDPFYDFFLANPHHPETEIKHHQQESEYFRGNLPYGENFYRLSDARFNFLDISPVLNLTYSKTTTTTTRTVTAFCTTSTATLTTCTPGARRRRSPFNQNLPHHLYQGNLENDGDLFDTQQDGKDLYNRPDHSVPMNGNNGNEISSEKLSYPSIEPSIKMKRNGLVSFVVSTSTSTVITTSTSTLTAICRSTSGYPLCSGSGR